MALFKCARTNVYANKTANDALFHLQYVFFTFRYKEQVSSKAFAFYMKINCKIMIFVITQSLIDKILIYYLLCGF